MNGLFAPLPAPQNNMNMPYPQRNDPFMFPNNSAPQQQMMNPQQAEVDALNAQVQQAKYTVGDPMLDKYINMFIGD